MELLVLSSSGKNASFGVGGKGERGNGEVFRGSGDFGRSEVISNSTPGLRSALLGRVEGVGVSGRTLAARLPVLDRLRKFCFRFSLSSAAAVRGFLGGS